MASRADLIRWQAALEAIAKNGIAFTPNVCDRERYDELLAIAREMGNGRETFPDRGEPIIDLVDGRGPDALRLRDDDDLSIATRYVTPKVGVSVVLGDNEGRVLLIKRAASGHWGLVGGYADVGYSPAEVAIKEAKEEVGLDVEITDLVGVMDGLQARHRPIPEYGVIFLGRVVGGELTLHPQECSDARWFAPHHLPEPLVDDGHLWVELAFEAVAGTLTCPYFDAPRAAVTP